MRKLQLLFGAVVAFAVCAAAHANLTHEFSFNNGTANDSIGGVTGTLLNGASISGGQLHLANSGANNPSSGEYVSLSANIVNYPAFTVEAWATTGSTVQWQRIVDIGSSSNGFGAGYVMMTPYNGAGTITGQTDSNSGAGNFAAGPSQVGNGTIAPGTQYQYAYVHDVTTGQEQMYVDGLPVINQGAPFAATVNASQQYFPDDWIGRSQYALDPYFVGTINEIRVYNQALTAAQVAAEYAAGPDVVTVPEPATAGVLALGLILTTRPRRRLSSHGVH